MRHMIFVICILTVLLSASAVSADEIRISTGYIFIKRVIEPIRSAFRDRTDIDLDIRFSSPVLALADLEKGFSDAAAASLPLGEWLRLAATEGIATSGPEEYTSYTPVIERSRIVVNSANSVRSLSKEQLKDIFTGRVTNWKQVCGIDAPILVVWPSITSGAFIMFKIDIMDGEPLTKTVYDVESIADMADAIAETPESIGIVAEATPEKRLRDVSPTIDRPLTFITKGKPSPKLQKLLDFMKGEGKHLIK